MRHLPLTFRGFRVAARGDQPYKTRCGMHLRTLGLVPSGEALCPVCVRARSGSSNSYDLQMDEAGIPAHERGQEYLIAPGKLSVEQAVDRAKMVTNRGLLSQDAYQAISRRLEPKDRYPFDMELVAKQIRVRTGAVNIVDRPEPGLGQPSGGDSLLDLSPLDVQVGKTPAGGEDNDSLGGTFELSYSGPRRSEGEVQQATPSGHDLGDLVLARVAQQRAEEQGLAISGEEMGRLLLEGVGLEYSQQLRYQTYAETLRIAYRTPLADEFLDHAASEAEHAAFLLKRAILMGAKPMFKVEQPVMIDPEDPDALGKILEELWKREQAGIEYYLELRDACGTSAMRHTIEEILVKELEHTDDLLRLGHRMHHEGALEIPGPSYPFRSEPARWNESYSNENAFEGLDKMGTEHCTCGVPMPDSDGTCLACKRPVTGSAPRTASFARVEVSACLSCFLWGPRWVEACAGCTGITAAVASPVCMVCQGVREVIRCACGAVHPSTKPFLTKERRVAWSRKVDAVKRITRCGEVPVHLEYEAGDIRSGVSPVGIPWQRTMQSGYGYIPGTVGADDEPLDVYLGGNPSRTVYVVNQLGPEGQFDEEKVMMGFSSPETAEATYRAHYPKNGDSHFGGMRPMGMDEFVSEYVEPDRPDAYQPTVGLAHVPLMPKEGDHKPGDADGCGGDGKSQPVKKQPAVDTSEAVSPAEQAWRGQPGHGKTMYDQMWRLLGGPQFNPYQPTAGLNVEAQLDVQSFEDLHKQPYDDDYSLPPGKNKGFSGPAVTSPPVGGMSGIGAAYDQPDHGVLGDPDPPQDERVVTHAEKKI